MVERDDRRKTGECLVAPALTLPLVRERDAERSEAG
jgi:hypothetical protein